MEFWIILACMLLTVGVGVGAVMADEIIAMKGGFHKKHL